MEVSMDTHHDASPKPKVLIVEDQALIRLDLVEQLRARGYETIEAANATEAMTLLERNGTITAVFIDIELPGTMNGLLLARHVSRNWPDIAIIISSGFVDPNVDQMPFGTTFLPKPSRAADMRRAFETIENRILQ
jgi:CheY-like chemotaxis protein